MIAHNKLNLYDNGVKTETFELPQVNYFIGDFVYVRSFKKYGYIVNTIINIDNSVDYSVKLIEKSNYKKLVPQSDVESPILTEERLLNLRFVHDVTYSFEYGCNKEAIEINLDTSVKKLNTTYLSKLSEADGYHRDMFYIRPIDNLSDLQACIRGLSGVVNKPDYDYLIWILLNAQV